MVFMLASGKPVEASLRFGRLISLYVIVIVTPEGLTRYE
jgi:hypothetical protein